MSNLLLALGVGFLLSQFATLVTTIYLHRTLSHRALALQPGLTWVMRILTWMMTGIRPRQWVAVHRKHHAYTDVPGDPHSPLLEGFAMVQFANVALYRRVANDGVTVGKYARDIPPDGWDRALFDHALVGLSIGIAILCATFGWQVGLIAAAFHTVSYLLLNASINAIGHSWGRQPAESTAFNSQWLALITCGEGLHNNHHAVPTSATMALRKGEFDPAWSLIRLFIRAGWAAPRLSDSQVRERVTV